MDTFFCPTGVRVRGLPMCGQTCVSWELTEEVKYSLMLFKMACAAACFGKLFLQNVRVIIHNVPGKFGPPYYYCTVCHSDA